MRGRVIHFPLTYVVNIKGGKSGRLPYMDGMDLWKSLSRNKESPRSLFLHNIDETRFIQGLRVGDWKIVKGDKHLS